MIVRLRWCLFVVLLVGLLLAVGGPSTYGQVDRPDSSVVPLPTGPDAADLAVAVPTYTGCGGELAPVVNGGYEQQVVELVNTTRAGQGLPPLKRNADLDQAARYYATDMGQDDYFEGDHGTYDRQGGALVATCAMAERIPIYYSPYEWIGENIAAGYSTPQGVMNGWMGSQGHRDNILSTDFWEIGVGYYTGSGSEAPYWVQDFGRQPAVYPVIIDGEAATTDSRNVSLYIYGDWDEMRLRNEDGTWTDWQAFQANPSWTLTAGDGQKTVCVELRKGSVTTQSCDTISLSGSVEPPPGDSHFVFLPLVRRDAAVSPSGWVTIVQEDFEGAFPGSWHVSDQGAGTGDFYWGKRSCRAYAGSNSGWAVGGGSGGAALTCGSSYPNSVTSWMMYGPFSLVGATAADLTFQLWLNTEAGFADILYYGASIDGGSFQGYSLTGDSQGWDQETLDLTQIPKLGSLVGRPQVWIALVFQSNSSVTYPEGAYVDNVVLRKYVPSASQTLPPEPADGLEAPGWRAPGLTTREATLQR